VVDVDDTWLQQSMNQTLTALIKCLKRPVHALLLCCQRLLSDPQLSDALMDFPLIAAVVAAAPDAGVHEADRVAKLTDGDVYLPRPSMDGDGSNGGVAAPLPLATPMSRSSIDCFHAVSFATSARRDAS